MKKTVFILGAGASKTYGFPLGNELRRSIVKNYGNVIPSLARLTQNNQFAQNSYAFRDHFEKSGDTSIDLFLSKFNAQHSEVGIAAVLYHIFMSETQSQFLDRLYFQHKDSMKSELLDDWMWYLYDRLTRNYNLSKTYDEINFSEISFINFNYDRSLEHFFYERLLNGFNYDEIGGSAKEILSTFIIEHIYGKVASLPWQEDSLSKLEYGGFNVDRVNIELFINNIKLIGDRIAADKEKIKKQLSEAENIFFLGFGYDETNLKVLEIPQSLNQSQRIYGTAIGYLPEEIEDIKKYFYYKAPGFPGVQKHNVFIENLNCTTLLRKYFR